MSEKGLKMRAGGLITAFLLGVGLCFISLLTRGQVICRVSSGYK